MQLRLACFLINAHNDFLSEGGPLSPPVRQIAEEENLLDHVRQIIATARRAQLHIRDGPLQR